MRGAPPDAARRAALLAHVGLVCMLAVVAASAYIRLRASYPSVVDATLLARGVHRVAASAAGIAVIALAYLAWRRNAGARAAVTLALGLTLLLAWLGAATGISPPPAASLGNLAGGLALAALLAWIYVPVRDVDVPIKTTWCTLALAAVGSQALLGAWMATMAPEDATVFVLHVLLGIAAAALAGWLGVRLAAAGRAPAGFALIGLAALAPALGIVSVLLEPPAEFVFLHAVAAALLLAALARLRAAHPRGA
jgi:heme A synthase